MFIEKKKTSQKNRMHNRMAAWREKINHCCLHVTATSFPLWYSIYIFFSSDYFTGMKVLV